MAKPKTKIPSPVEFVRWDVLSMLPIWEKIRAACDGEEAVKALGEKVLPRPNPLDTSPENNSRFIAYLTRAVWYNVTQRTLSGMAGYVFQKEPTVNLPSDMATLEDNVDGSGVTILQQAKAALRWILSLGRCGLLVDYPTTNGEPVTKADINTGNIAPTIVLYEAEQITNWKTSHVGSKTLLDLLVLKETYVDAAKDNPFEMFVYTQYRVLERTDAGVIGNIHRQGDGDEYTMQPDLTYAPKDKSGNPLKEIPFTFLGSVNNDACVDHAPLADLANLNFAHFRNSADYEEACFLVGQPTPWISGLTKSWVEETLKGQVHIGSRAVIPLPVGGQAGLLQASPNTLPMEAMKHKEEQMLSLGAQLIQQQEVQQTATEAGLRHASEVSTLTAAANNVFLGYKRALEFAGEFVGTDTASVEFELSEPLTQDTIDAQYATALTAMWQSGLVDFEEVRAVLKKSGVAYLPDNVVKDRADNSGLRTPPPAPNVPPSPNLPPAPPAPKPRPALK